MVALQMRQHQSVQRKPPLTQIQRQLIALSRIQHIDRVFVPNHRRIRVSHTKLHPACAVIRQRQQRNSRADCRHASQRHARLPAKPASRPQGIRQHAHRQHRQHVGLRRPQICHRKLCQGHNAPDQRPRSQRRRLSHDCAHAGQRQTQQGQQIQADKPGGPRQHQHIQGNTQQRKLLKIGQHRQQRSRLCRQRHAQPLPQPPGHSFRRLCQLHQRGRKHVNPRHRGERQLEPRRLQLHRAHQQDHKRRGAQQHHAVPTPPKQPP